MPDRFERRGQCRQKHEDAIRVGPKGAISSTSAEPHQAQRMIWVNASWIGPVRPSARRARAQG